MASTLRRRVSTQNNDTNGRDDGGGTASSTMQSPQENSSEHIKSNNRDSFHVDQMAMSPTSSRKEGTAVLFQTSVTQLPIDAGRDDSAYDETLIPTADATKESPKHSAKGGSQVVVVDASTSQASSDFSSKKDTATTVDGGMVRWSNSDVDGIRNANQAAAADASVKNVASAFGTAPRKAMSGKEVAKDESRVQKILIRAVSGMFMMTIFGGCIAMGHIYVCMIVAFTQVALFRELVKVRYHAHYETISGGTIPLFRTLQWMWFSVAILYTYGDFIAEVIQHNPQLHGYLNFAHYATIMSFALYSGTFVLTIATMQVGHIKFQLNQLCWTIVVLCLTVGQLKYIMHNIFNGLFWFTLPIFLVVTNDVSAYVCGMTCGRKFIQRKFIAFSPNKTWEGFLGGGICTIIFSWFLSRQLAQYRWMTCPNNEFRLFPHAMECDLHHIFQPSQSILPHQIFELFPPSLVKMIPGIVEICSVRMETSLSSVPPLGADLLTTPCISGEPSHSFHHFELVLKNVYPVQIHALWLALFASMVAPFGGFLASAIKRAYGIKDFDSIIPGHGGVMDRMDCQFLMALCTWVHYNTFVKLATVSVPKLLYMYSLLSQQEQSQFIMDLVLENAAESLNSTEIQQLLSFLKLQQRK